MGQERVIPLDEIIDYYNNQVWSCCMWLNRIGDEAANGNKKAEKFLLDIMTNEEIPDDHRLIAHGHLYLNVRNPQEETLVALKKFREFSRSQAEKRLKEAEESKKRLKRIYTKPFNR